MRMGRAFLALLAVVLLLSSDAVRAEEGRPLSAEFLYAWNHETYRALQDLNALDLGGDNPPRTSRAFAMVHLAVYDAVNGLDANPKYEPFRMKREETTPASKEAALMGAAYTVLTSLFGEGGSEKRVQENPFTFNLMRQNQYIELLDRGVPQEEIDAGFAWGVKVAEDMIAWRTGDGADVAVEYVYDEDNMERGRYHTDKFTPDAADPPAEPGWGDVKPFAINSRHDFEVPGPPAFGSAKWEEQLAEVRELGRRSRYNPENYEGGVLPEEIEYQWRTAFFWAAKGLDADGGKNNLGTTTPIGHWCQIAEYVSRQQELSLEEAVRMFALLSLANADATIATWGVKYDYAYWRPIHAIRWGLDEDHPDADWLPLIPTSMHPEYISGHCGASGASATMLAHYFGTDAMTFTVTGDDALDEEYRTYESFWTAAVEAGDSRIYGGIHYRFSNEHALELGRDIAEYVFANFLRPVEADARQVSAE